MKLTAERQRLCTENLGLVHGVIHEMRRKRNRTISLLDYDDAYSAGLLGLVIAAGRFDESRQVKFGTYAWHWIRYTIQEAGCKSLVVANPRRFFSDNKQFKQTHLQGNYYCDISSMQMIDSQEYLSDARMDFDSLISTMEPKVQTIMNQVRQCHGNVSAAARIRGVTSQRAQQIYDEAIKAIRKRFGIYVAPKPKRKAKRTKKKNRVTKTRCSV